MKTKTQIQASQNKIKSIPKIRNFEKESFENISNLGNKNLSHPKKLKTQIQKNKPENKTRT